MDLDGRSLNVILYEELDLLLEVKVESGQKVCGGVHAAWDVCNCEVDLQDEVTCVPQRWGDDLRLEKSRY